MLAWLFICLSLVCYGSVGAGVVAQAKDQHTVLLSDMSSVATAPLFIPDLPYKATDLQGVTMLAYSPQMLVAAPSAPLTQSKRWSNVPRKKINVSSSMPKAAVEKLSAALISVIRTPQLRARLAAAGAEVMTSTPAELSTFLANERKRWGNVIQKAGKKLEGTV